MNTSEIPPYPFDYNHDKRVWRDFVIIINMIKAVLFDYAGVITSGIPSKELTVRIAENLYVDEDAARKLLMIGWQDFSRGKISEEKFWERMESELGRKISDDRKDIWETFSEHLQPLPEIIELIEWLREQKKTVGLLSNVIPPTANDIRNNGGYDHFDFVVLSCEVGYRKPESKIYKLALEKISEINHEEILFIDDMENNLLPASELGMKTILAENPQQVIREIKELIK